MRIESEQEYYDINQFYFDFFTPELWEHIDHKAPEGIYQISNMGRVKNAATGQIISQQIKKKRRDKGGGYACVKLSVGNKRNGKGYAVHRLVALAFIPNPENKPYVDHINRDSLDNNVENLRWCTAKENAANQGPSKGRKHKGVYKRVTKNKNFPDRTYWHASVGVGGYIGVFDTEEEAVLAVNKKTKELHGEFACLNNEN